MQSKHILVVDDDKQTGLALRIILKKAGYQVTEPDDGTDAFSTIVNSQGGPDAIDLLILDTQHLELTGLDLLDELQKAKLTLPILALTWYGTKETRLKLKRKGCNHHIEKPIQAENLTHQINSIFKKNDGSTS